MQGQTGNEGSLYGQPGMGGGGSWMTATPGGNYQQGPWEAGYSSGSGDGSGGGPYYAPPDGSVAAAEQYAMAEKAYQQALARFNQQRKGLLAQNGYAGDINAKTGMVGNVRVDPNSLYGNLQEMLHGQALEDQNATFGAQDRNLIGGLANQAASELAYEHHGQTTSLANTLLDNLSNINSQQVDAKSALDQALWQMQQAAAGNAIAAGNFNPVQAIADAAAGTRFKDAPTFTPSATRSAQQTMQAVNPGGYNELQAWSRAMNAKYGASPAKTRKALPNAYKTNKNKRG